MAAKNVTVIPATVNPVTKLPHNSAKKRRVAGYARVSTDSEEQLTSYEAQVDYYTQYIQANPNWQFVGVYTDAPVIIGLKPNPTKTGAALVLFSLFTGIFETFR